MKKTLTWILTIIAGLVLSISIMGGVRAEASTVTVNAPQMDGTYVEKEFTQVTSIPAPAANTEICVQLTQDIDLRQHVLAEGESLYIDLNGHDCNGITGSRTFHTESANTTLVIFNSNKSKSASITKVGHAGGYADFLYVHSKATNAKVILEDFTIKNASAGSWGGACFFARGEVCLNRMTFENCSVPQGGGAVYIETIPVVMNDCLFTGCSSNNGGAIYLNSGTLTLNNCSVVNCEASENGGGIYSKSTFNYNSGTISNCSATTRGGGIYATSTSTLNLVKGGVENCTAAEGANIFKDGATGEFITTHYIDDNGIVQIETHEYQPVSSLPTPTEGATDYVYLTASITGQYVFANNQTLYVDLNGYSITGGSRCFFCADMTNPKLVVTDSSTNSEGLLTAGSSGMAGMCIWIGAKTSTVILDNVTLQGSTAANSYGGCIAMRGSGGSSSTQSLFLYNTTIQNCKNTGDATSTTIGGGAIGIREANANGSKVTIINSKFDSCSSTTRGGAIWVSDSCTNVTLTVEDTEFVNCSTGEGSFGGGAIYSAGNTTITDCTFDGCNSTNGGAIYASNGGTLKILDCTFTSNTAAQGGALYNKANSTITDGSFTRNDASNRGGAIYNSGTLVLNESENGTLVFGGSSDDKNTTVKFGANIHSVGGNVTINGGTYSYGSADGGGNISFFYTSTAEPYNTLSILGGKIEYGSSTSTTHGGGNICFYADDYTEAKGEYGVLNISGTAVIQNGSAYKGGNIQIRNSKATFNMSGGTIKDGSATSCGGNINFDKAAEVTISDGTISGGTSNGHSGSLRLVNSSFSMTGGTITGGQTIGDSALHGGNITASGPFSMTGGTISNGVAKDYAGNIFYSGSSFSMSGNAKIIDGIAGTYGGNIRTNACTFRMSDNAQITGGKANSGYGGNLSIGGAGSLTMEDNALISGGTSTAQGGNITIGGGSSVTMSGYAKIANGTCGTSPGGGNVYSAGTITMSDLAEISGGESGSIGGNISFESANSLTMNGESLISGGVITCEPSKNSNGTVITGYAGNIYAGTSTITLNGSARITGGTATAYGGSIVLTTGTLYIKDNSIITGGTAADNGGGVYVAGGTISMTGGSITKCSSGARGGAIFGTGACSITIGSATIGGSSENKNTATLNGGGIIIDSTGSLTVGNGAVISYNESTGGSGGNIAGQSGATVTIEEGATIECGKSTSGGNIIVCNNANNGSSLIINGGTIKDGISTGSGGNIVLRDRGVSFTMNGGTIDNGTAATYGGNIAVLHATGAAAGTLSNFEIKTGSTISNGQAGKNNFGGNIAVNMDGVRLTLSGGTISGGKANQDGAYGGNIAVPATDVVLTVSGATVSGGKSKRYAGNISIVSGSTLKIQDGALITGGTTLTAQGGNITCSGSIDMTGGTVTSGHSASYAGNIFFNGSSFTMSGGTISNGYATTYGGNVCATSSFTMSNDAMIIGGSVGEFTLNEGGSVATGFAGSVYLTGGSSVLTMEDTASISGGVASAYGGNVVLTAGTLTMNDSSSITGGVAETNGGNITVTGAGRINLHDNATVSGGTANTAHGGNIALNNGGTFIMDGGKVLNGTAYDAAANLYLAGSGNLTISAGQIIGYTLTNTDADPVHGNIYVTSSVTPLITGGYFESIYASTNNQFITGGYFINAPKNRYLANGYLNQKSSYTEDSVTYYYHVVAIGTAADAYKYTGGGSFYDTGEGNFVQISTGVTESAYFTYLNSLALTKISDNGTGLDNGNVLLSTYKDAADTFRLHVSYMKQTQVLYVEYSTDLETSPYLNATASAGTAFENTVLVMPSLTVATTRPDTATGYAAGNSFIIRLKNGHFIVSDGGNRVETDTFLDILDTMTPGNEKPVIEAWFLTHPHSDHFGVLKKILEDEDLRDEIIVNGVYMSSQVYSEAYGEYNSIQWIIENVNLFEAESGNAKFYRPYTGQVYCFDDVVVEIALSQDQLPVTEVANYSGDGSLSRNSDLNDTSLFTMIRIGDQKVLLGGDGDYGCARFMELTYSDDYRTVDVMSLLHHGYNIKQHFKCTSFTGDNSTYSTTDLLFNVTTMLYTGWDDPNATGVYDSSYNEGIYPYSSMGNMRFANIYQNSLRKNLVPYLAALESQIQEHYSYAEGTRVLVFPYTVGDSFVFEAHDAADKCWDAGAETLAPTCTETGIWTHHCIICGTQTLVDTIAAIGHAYVFDGFVWTEYSAVAHYTCDHDHEHTTTVVPTITSEVTVAPTFTATGTKVYTAVVSAANSADEAEHSDTAEEVLAALVVEFKHAVSGTIGENFSVGMSLDLSALPDGTDLSGLKVVVSTKTGTRELPVGADGKIDIVLNPEELTMPLNPELYCGSTKLDDRSDNPNFSAAAYIKALASSDQATPEMKAMLTGLLEYGAAAQQYFNYRLNDLANADAYKFEGYGAPDYADPATTDQNYAAGTDVRIRYANLYLQNDKVLIQFNVVAPVGSEYTLTDELSAAVNGTTDQLSYTVRTGALNMSDLAGKVYTLVVTNGSDESRVTYSVANYVYNKVHDDNTGEAMKNLAKALWVYSNAAGAYAVATP